ncbi:MAG: ATP-binding protein [Clostridiales bacterium]|nr:ATP-binding protein [Clostridiales bacterium]
MKPLFKKQIIVNNPLAIRKLANEMMNHIRNWNSLDEEDLYEFRLIINELICNGIKHGNKGFCDKKVSIQIEEVDSNTLDISVKDEGPGFDYSHIGRNNHKRKCLEELESGRGLMLVNALCNKIQFNKEGNQVRVTKTICQK